jgi:hypothetical protein
MHVSNTVKITMMLYPIVVLSLTTLIALPCSADLEARRIQNKGDSWKKYERKQLQEREICPKPPFVNSDDGGGDSRMPSFLIRPIRRVRNNNMTVAEFQEKFSRSDVAIPIIFENPDFDESVWSPQSFVEECGHISVVDGDDDNPEYHSVREVYSELIGQKWAGLGFPNLTQLNITTLEDLIRAQGTPEGKGLYLHDAPLSHYCPPKVDKIKVPKYFPRNYDAIAWDPAELGLGPVELEKQWPSVFLSKQGTGSRLHADSRMTRFYTQVLYGAKLWRVTPPSEYWRLAPNFEPEDAFYPSIFEADIINPNFNKNKDLDGTLVYETIMKPGDVLFLPEGWPHQVHNVKESVMTGANFFDNAVLDFAVRCLEYEENTSGDLTLWKAFFMPLDDPQFESNEEDIPWTDFFKAQHLQVVPVPKWFEEQVEEEPDWMINYRDPDGYPALHVAAEYNFLNMVEFLLDEADVDVNFVDRKGITALDLATILKYKELEKLLLEYGALHGNEVSARKPSASSSSSSLSSDGAENCTLATPL